VLEVDMPGNRGPETRLTSLTDEYLENGVVVDEIESCHNKNVRDGMLYMLVFGEVKGKSEQTSKRGRCALTTLRGARRVGDARWT
jgi:hypothetical protein